MKWAVLAGLCGLLPNFSIAADHSYLRTGAVEATVCKGFVIKACGFVGIDSVEVGGQRHEIATAFPSVSEFSNGRCHIRTASEYGGLIDAVLDLVKGTPRFFRAGEIVEHVESITFKCTRQ